MSKLKSKATERLTMPGQIHKAYKVLLKLLKPQIFDGDQQIPLSIIANAKGIAFITVVKAGFVFSGTLGAGIVIAKLPDGRWSGPSSIGVGGMGWGAQIGASSTDSVIILNTDSAVKAFSGNSQVKFGGNVSVAVGPVGRDAEASINAGDGGVASCYSYSHSRGFFGGISLQGAVLATRHDDNERFYGRKIPVSDILHGKVQVPPNPDYQALVQTLAQVQAEAARSGQHRNSPEASFTRQSFDSSGWAESTTAPEFSNTSNQARYATSSGAMGFAPAGQTHSPSFTATGSSTSASHFHQSQGNQPQGHTSALDLNQKSFDIPQAPQRRSVPPPPPTRQSKSQLPQGWSELKTDAGETYYWNEVKNSTQWERPTSPSQGSPSYPQSHEASTRASAPQSHDSSGHHASAPHMPVYHSNSTTQSNDVPQRTSAPPVPGRSLDRSVRGSAPPVPAHGNLSNSPPKIPTRSPTSAAAAATGQSATTSASLYPAINQSNSQSHFDGSTNANVNRSFSEVEDVKVIPPSPDYTYDQVVNKSEPGFDPARLEEYLTDAEFEKVFKTKRQEFNSLPIWKKQNLKKELHLW